MKKKKKVQSAYAMAAERAAKKKKATKPFTDLLDEMMLRPFFCAGKKSGYNAVLMARNINHAHEKFIQWSKTQFGEVDVLKHRVEHEVMVMEMKSNTMILFEQTAYSICLITPEEDMGIGST